MFNGRRQPSNDGTSRMTRECQVRLCERLGVKFPGPTRPGPLCPHVRDDGECWRGKRTYRRPRNQSVVTSPNCIGMTPPEGRMAIHIRRREFITVLGGA